MKKIRATIANSESAFTKKRMLLMSKLVLELKLVRPEYRSELIGEVNVDNSQEKQSLEFLGVVLEENGDYQMHRKCDKRGASKRIILNTINK